ncbi:hypothetical protein ABE036_24900 [Priestia aryabhattai]|uniref:hypothetical protein n=1 Tax=Priestia TaxID=2800373 RepID=UPI001C30A1F3|nr:MULTISPECIES: hypothetical protein [Priestia]MBY0065330.1 hypothetical protein [Priestia aryabhattai]MDN3365538.1 hypothetical protein [Priestia megaterium]WKU20906.1 hypothetical protein Q3A90_00095 [Priestia megaterium]WKU20917.1 hypothetical protein Q3A90_00045 [Priestia megaterium]
MKFPKKVVSLSLVTAIALGVTTTPIHAAMKDDVTNQQVLTVDGEAVTFNFYENDNIRKYDVIEDGKTTTVEYNKDENTLYINGEQAGETETAMVESLADTNLNSEPTVKTNSFTTMATSAWMDGGTKKGSTKIGVMSASALAAAVAAVIGGGVAGALLSAASVIIGMGVPTVYYTDKQKFRMVGASLEIQHSIKFYKDSARKKLIRSSTYTTRDLAKG